MKYFLLGLCMVMFPFLIVNEIKGAQMLTQTRSDMVYTVCNQSRVSPYINEQECGRLQDEWNREFLCKNNNTNPNNVCWVEVK